jgi:hemolysin III
MTNKTVELSAAEERLNTLSHGIGAIFSIIGLFFLGIWGLESPRDWSFFSAIIFGVSLTAVLLSSSIFHGVEDPELKRKCQIVDHACIFLLIAGTYTPILLVSLGDTAAWGFFSAIWCIAALGIYIKVNFMEEFKKYSIAFYLGISWSAMFRIGDIMEQMPQEGFLLLLLGGALYTVGTIFYAMTGKVQYAHFLWHLFVIGAGAMHYFMVLFYII